MSNNAKPLDNYEQSFLMTALLFDNKNVDQLLHLLPKEQSERLAIAKQQFMSLAREERLTQAVLELKRLLFIKENRHKEQNLEQTIKKEPKYLQKIILDGANKEASKLSQLAFNIFIS